MAEKGAVEAGREEVEAGRGAVEAGNGAVEAGRGAVRKRSGRKNVKGAVKSRGHFFYRHLLRERNIVSVNVSDRFTTDTCLYSSVCSLTIANLLRGNSTVYK